MIARELISLFRKAHRKTFLLGTEENGMILALDLEGRIFPIINGMIVNKIDPNALNNHHKVKEYINPGGDVLWPAPEGTCFGYEYATGRWRIPPSIINASWKVISSSLDRAVIAAEIDLVNNLQVGIPCVFERHIKVIYRQNKIIQDVKEIIRYIGIKTLKRNEFLIAPWSLCQFESGPECRVVIPDLDLKDIWDLYSSSYDKRYFTTEGYNIETETDIRFQVGLSENVEKISFRRGKELRICRYSKPLSSKSHYIDISDSSPDQIPSPRGIKYSIYSDPSGFMEIEACGGCPEKLEQGTEMSVNIITEFEIDSNIENKSG